MLTCWVKCISSCWRLRPVNVCFWIAFIISLLRPCDCPHSQTCSELLFVSEPVHLNLCGSFLLQLLGFSPSSQCELVLSAESSSDLVEDLGLCAVSQAKCLLWLEQWSIVCLWMRSLCLNPALDCRSAQSLLHTAMCKHSKYRWTPLAVYPKSWI